MPTVLLRPDAVDHGSAYVSDTDPEVDAIRDVDAHFITINGDGALLVLSLPDVPDGVTVTNLHAEIDYDIDNSAGTSDVAFRGGIGIVGDPQDPQFAGGELIVTVAAGDAASETYAEDLPGSWSAAAFNSALVGLTNVGGDGNDIVRLGRVNVTVTYSVPAASPRPQRLSLSLGLGL